MPNTAYASTNGPLGPKPHGADYNAATMTRPFTLTTEDAATTYYLWVDTTGRLRIKSSAPTSATDGTIVGTQS